MLSALPFRSQGKAATCCPGWHAEEPSRHILVAGHHSAKRRPAGLLKHILEPDGLLVMLAKMEAFLAGLPPKLPPVEGRLHNPARLCKAVAWCGSLQPRERSAQVRWEQVGPCGRPLAPLDEGGTCALQRPNHQVHPLRTKEAEANAEGGRHNSRREQQEQVASPARSCIGNAGGSEVGIEHPNFVFDMQGYAMPLICNVSAALWGVPCIATSASEGSAWPQCRQP